MESLSEPRVFVDANRIAAELNRRFNVNLEELQGVARAIYRGFVQVTSLHPKGFNGTNGWAEGTSQLRAAMIPKGWHPDDPQGQPRIVSNDGKIGITLSSGNSDTGVPNRTPQTRNDKGSQTASSVRFNARQGQLFPLVTVDNTTVPLHSANGESLWIFLYFIDFDAHEMRFEISQPTGMSDADKVNGWSIRYIMPPMQFDTWPEEHRDDSPEIDFDITSKDQ